MESTNFLYVVIDRSYLMKTNSIKAIRFSREFMKFMDALLYVRNSGRDDCMIITIPQVEYYELKERIERLCF